MTRPGVLKSVLVGALAGLVASYAMEKAQALLAKKLPAVQNAEEPSSTTRAADKLAVLAGGGPMPDAERSATARAIHYATGAALGGLYGLLARGSRAASAGFGVAYGLAVSLVLDEILVPALDLGPAPTRSPPETHLYGLANHVVFGAALEAGRRVGLAAL